MRTIHAAVLRPSLWLVGSSKSGFAVCEWVCVIREAVIAELVIRERVVRVSSVFECECVRVVSAGCVCVVVPVACEWRGCVVVSVGCVAVIDLERVVSAL